MALINCSECGNMVSSMAVACPRCGCPVNKMTLKSRFYFEIDKEIYEGCFPIILKVDSKEFRINSFWAGQGCICVAEVFSNEISTNEEMVADVKICYTLQNPSWSSTEEKIVNFNNISLGKNYLFNCTPFEKKVKYGDDIDLFIGMDITASSVSDNAYNNLPLADLSKKKKIKKTSKSTKKYTPNPHPPATFKIDNGILTSYTGCASNITIPNSVTSIGNHAFYFHKSLTSVTIGNSVTSIGDCAFCECESLASITIPNSVTSIGKDAFSHCESLESVAIGNGVTSIGNSAFFKSNKLTSLTIAKGNSVYHSAENCIIETASKTLVAGCKTSVIPNDGSVTSIGKDAFSHCESLASITIPNSVTSIGEFVFFKCTALTSITIPDSVTSIGKFAFADCFKLTIHAPAGSYAEQYSKENRIHFKAI